MPDPIAAKDREKIAGGEPLPVTSMALTVQMLKAIC